MKFEIENYKKIVIKIGSAILVEDYKIRVGVQEFKIPKFSNRLRYYLDNN